MPDVIYEISSKGLGMACVVAADGTLKGIITDGDLRRHMVSATHLLERTAGEIMTTSPITVPPDTMAAAALHILEQRRITAVVVVDLGQHVLGVVHLHDLWRIEMF
jgi:arabinose-5-phosphate isomerase